MGEAIDDVVEDGVVVLEPVGDCVPVVGFSVGFSEEGFCGVGCVWCGVECFGGFCEVLAGLFELVVGGGHVGCHGGSPGMGVIGLWHVGHSWPVMVYQPRSGWVSCGSRVRVSGLFCLI